MRFGILSLRFAKRKLKSCVFYREQKRGERERERGKKKKKRKEKRSSGDELLS